MYLLIKFTLLEREESIYQPENKTKQEYMENEQQRIWKHPWKI